MVGLKKWVAVVGCAVSASLASCGGGGPDGSSTPVTPRWEGALASLNAMRVCAGVKPLAWSAELALASQRHADYMKANGEFSHGETAGKAGYSGANITERVAAAGFPTPPGSLQGEVMTGGESDTARVDVLRLGVLSASSGHLAQMVAPDWTHAGMGASPLTVALAHAGSAQRGFSMYPCEGAVGVGDVASNSLGSIGNADGSANGPPMIAQGSLFDTVRVRGAWLKSSTGEPVELSCLGADGQATSMALCAAKMKLNRGQLYSWGFEMQDSGVWRPRSATFKVQD